MNLHAESARLVVIFRMLVGVLPCSTIVMMEFLVVHGTGWLSLAQILYLLRFKRTSWVLVHGIPAHFK